MNNAPIGIFDSGIGGLTVAKQIIKDLPHESIIYLGDTARVPYGTRSKEVVTKFALELADFLLTRNVKCLVVACNTISALSLEEIRQRAKVPVIGVVKPAVEEALHASKTKKIGVIGTQGTISSHAYDNEIKNNSTDAIVTSGACPLFVPIAEEGFNHHEATKLIAHDYLEKLIKADIDTLILGCTHYPLLYEAIKETVGEKVKLIDSAIPTTRKLKQILQQKDLLSDNPNPTYEFFVTDAPERVKKVAGRFFGEELNGKLKKVSLDH